MMLKLQTRFTLNILAVIVLVVMLMGTAVRYAVQDSERNATAASAQAMEEALAEQILAHGSSLTRLLADNLVNPLYYLDVGRIADLIKSVKNEPGVGYVQVYDIQGVILHDGSSELAKAGEKVPTALLSLPPGQPLIIRSEKLLEVTWPIMLGSQRLGGVRIGFALDSLTEEVVALKQQLAEISEQQHRRNHLLLLGIGLGIAVLGVGIAVVMARGLNHPIRQLSQAAAMFGRGEDSTLAINRGDELGELAANFQQMQSSLARNMVSRRQLRDIIDSMNDALLVTSADGVIQSLNTAAARMVGVAPADLVGSDIRHLFFDMPPLQPDEPVRAYETALWRIDNRTIPVLLAISVLDGNEGDTGYVVTAADISERLESEKAQRLAANIFSNLTEGVMVTDAEANIIQVNEAFTQITGYQPEDVLGHNPKMLSSGRQPESFFRAMWSQLQREGAWRGEIWNQRKDGSDYAQWLSIVALRNRSGEIENYVGIITDITERKEAEEQVAYHANYDNLTGLPNRRMFYDYLAELLETRYVGRKVALLFLDLDGFKLVNDSLGHAQGDHLLRAVARLLREDVRASDMVARLGGDEFTVVLKDADAEKASQVARHIIETVSRPYELNGHQVFVTSSIGIALYPDDATDAHLLIQQADTAMYHAKEHGKNGYKFFTEELNLRAVSRLKLENRLREALHGGEFALRYQPRVHTATRQVTGVEALLHWDTPDQGIIEPMEFIPIAEEMGIIVPLGEQVLYDACEQARRWRDEGMDGVRLSVNLSARQFAQRDLVEQVRTILKDTGLSPNSLELEITETAIMDNAEANIERLHDLHTLGVSLAVDDFGTGYSSLAYLKRLPIDILKIDRSFIHDIPENPDDAAIVNSIIAMAHRMGLRVTAEGVEQEAQFQHLMQEGCDECQGYLFSKPLNPERFVSYWRQHSR